MAKLKGEIWRFFWQGEKQNKAHFRAYCLGCIRKEMGQGSLNDEGVLNLSNSTEFQRACQNINSVNGVQKTMIAHILGGTKTCRNASTAAIDTAKRLRSQSQKNASSNKRKSTSDGDESDTTGQAEPSPSKRLKPADRTEKIQQKLKVYRGLDIPFNDEQTAAVKAQFLRATISAKLPFRWVTDPEVIKLFTMFRSTAQDVMPSNGVLSERLLDEEADRVEEELLAELNQKAVTLTCDGVKDISKNSLMGVSVSAMFRPYLVDLYDASADRKDGQAMADAFESMIDKVEGSKAGRAILVIRRPYLFAFPCCGHQGNLCVVDYFKVNADAKDLSEKAVDLIGWINNHNRVRCIFNDVQLEQTKNILTYLVAVITRWTTHLTAFQRLKDLKQPLRAAALTRREDIIRAQVGAERSGPRMMELTEAAVEQLDVIDNSEFWKGLSVVIEDLEPIAYATNICQSDKASPDPQRTHPSEEQLYMELLAQELDPNEECPDDGELEGSGDEYEDY
ncbi:hypothetical protein DFJ43DRAFT_1165259 [Lentinula guzmanii]|uniref:DUF659 domain-containing protein n=1 Tax=Lentinula guzmanii TaxID=2804957 RepID=A0AA38MVJ4_9AGAR|nr:hypothetical protein DFJ43DRAFT_1165259 [Lentinula guzmanii]